MHVRRGDFAKQFRNALIPPEELNQITEKYILEKNSTIYIATDEKNRTYFDILTQHYDICFLDDFANEVKGINRNLFGIISPDPKSVARESRPPECRPPECRPPECRPPECRPPECRACGRVQPQIRNPWRERLDPQTPRVYAPRV